MRKILTVYDQTMYVAILQSMQHAMLHAIMQAFTGFIPLSSSGFVEPPIVQIFLNPVFGFIKKKFNLYMLCSAFFKL